MPDQSQDSRLLIGWKTQGDGWSVDRPPEKPPSGLEASMVAVRAKDMARHTLVVGQSGAGKSYFLGRVIEEVMIRTRARCVVVDPNGDYSRVYDLAAHGSADPWDWEAGRYSEDSREDFKGQWDKVGVFFKTAYPKKSVLRAAGKAAKPQPKTPKFFWHEVPADLVASIVAPGDDPHLCRAVRSVHQFVQEAGRAFLEHLKGQKKGRVPDIVAKSQEAFAQTSWNDSLEALPPPRVWRGIIGTNDAAWRIYTSFMTRCTMPEHPFSAAVDLKGLFNAEEEASRLDVLDITSIEDPEVRMLTTGALIRYEWTRSRRLRQKAADAPGQKLQAGTGKPAADESRFASRFYPTFLVLDEAHNLIPRDGASPYVAVVRDQVRTIAAEGRKYGLFLVLCTQRPDKLDARVVSECQNAVVLRMVSREVLKETCTLLGVEPSAAEPCLSAPSNEGLGILFGDWAGEGERTGTRFKGAARRTAEGGVKLDEGWMTRR
jgi:hypothetical protein